MTTISCPPRYPIRAWGREQRGFTIVELLSASLLTLLFFGWLTYAYITATRAVLTWQTEWTVATETQRTLAMLTKDVESAVMLEGLSPSGVTIVHTDGRMIIYAQRSDGIYRSDRKLGGVGVTLTVLQLTGLWSRVDSVSGQRLLTEEAPPVTGVAFMAVPPEWLRIKVVGQAKDHIYTAQTVVRLYCQHPMLLREVDPPTL